MVARYVPSECPECGASVSIRGGELICNKCGLVLAGDLPEDGITPSEIKSMPQVHPQALPGRLGNAQRHVNRTSDRNMAFALSYIRRLTQSLCLPTDTAVEAIKQYKKAFSMRVIQGRNIEVLAAALTYAVSRQMRIPRTLKEICMVADLPERDVFRTYKWLSRLLRLKCPVCRPDDYLFRFANILEHGEKVKTRALEILSKMPKDGNRSPTTLAAAALYVAGLENNEHRSFKKVSRLLGVGEAAVRETVLEVAKTAQVNVGSEQVKLGLKKEVDISIQSKKAELMTFRTLAEDKLLSFV
jgi:transcription initiation factor TFIIIB Brf1 subunit/transcription initiation factor TFIIB